MLTKYSLNLGVYGMKYSRSLVLILVLFSSGLALYGQADWKTKNFDQWDKQDVETILNNSAWAKSQELRIQYEGVSAIAAGSLSTEVSRAGGQTGIGAAKDERNLINKGGIQPTLDFIFTLRLRSSMAVRLAIIRKNQLETDTSKLSKEELDLFNKRQKGLYECPACVENYVVTLSSRTKENKNLDAVYTAFAKAQLNDLKRYVVLQNDRGEKRELVFFTPPKSPNDEAVFFFNRYDKKGNALFTNLSKQLRFIVTNNAVNMNTNFVFDIAPMVVGDKVTF
jgi:hypothetical protein